jgi:dihydrodipicolinate synthase/N-acetylneuraminate lyase
MPIKMALHLMGILKSAECRLPMMTLSEENTQTLKKVMKEAGLLS